MGIVGYYQLLYNVTYVCRGLLYLEKVKEKRANIEISSVQGSELNKPLMR